MAELQKENFQTVRKRGPEPKADKMVGASLAEALAQAGADYEAQNPADAKRLDKHMEANASSIELAQTPTEQKRNIPPVRTWGEFKNVVYPKRKILIDPILASREIALVHADAGAGKSRFALFLAVCLASGIPCLKWAISKPKKVLYVEGELPGTEFQERIQSAIKEASASDDLVSANLGQWTEDEHGVPVPTLNTKAGRESLLEAVQGYDVVILDSLITLTNIDSQGRTHFAEELNTTLREVRALGCAVIVIHHTNKNGSFYGPMLQNVLTSLTLKLEKVHDDTPVEGCHFIVSFEKTRNIYGRDAEPVDVKCERGVWTYRSALETKKEQAIEMSRRGMKQKDIAEELGVRQGTVSRWLKDIPKK